MARPRRSRPARLKSPVVRIDGVSVVLLGSFNPPIFQPAWMAGQGLLDQADADSATINIIHAQVVSFRVDPLAIDITRDRFQIETTDETAVERLRDVVIGVFRRLSHTPVASFGINRNTHYEMPTQTKWHALGHRLVPKEPWEPILSAPGTRSLTVEGVRPDEYKGWIRVQFEPSVRIAQNGVYVAVNDHIQLDVGSGPTPASDAIDILGIVWDDAMERAAKFTTHVVGLV